MNATKLHAIETQMNEIAHELAKNMLQSNRAYLPE